MLVRTKADFKYAMKFHTAFPGVPFTIQLVNPVVSGSVDLLAIRRYEKQIIRWLDEAGVTDTKVLAQYHVLLHGNKRGV